MRIACVLLPHFAVQVEVRRRPELRRRPVVLVVSSTSRRVVLDASPSAGGITPGMPLQQALSHRKDTILIEADPPMYRQAFESVLECLGHCSPIVEDSGPGLAYVDLQGLTGMYGGEAKLTTALLNAVPVGFVAKVGIADGKYPAYIAAIRASSNGAYQAPDDVRSFLADVPVEWLPVSWETIRRLKIFGIETMKQVAAIGVGPMQAQFGPQGRLGWQLACGVDERAVVPLQVEESVAEEMSFPAPTANLGTMLVAVESLLGRAFLQPTLRGRYARGVLLEGEVFRRSPWQKRVVFRNAVGTTVRAFELLKGVLRTVDLPGPLESIRITLSGLTGESGQQGNLFSDVRQRQQLREALAQLEAHFGKPPPIYTVREVEPWSRIPERRHALIPFVP